MAASTFFLIICFFISISYAGEKGKLYVVGMGPAGPDLTAPRALAVIEEADVILCSPGMPKRFERFVMLTSPRSLFGESHEKDNILKDISRYDVTMVFYMSLSSMDRLVEKFRKYYPPDLPMAIVYYAGYAEKERVLRSRLGTILDDLKKGDEKWLGLLIVGESVL